MSGPSARVRDRVWAREESCCRRCGRRLTRGVSVCSIHHRQPRQMGGTSRPEVNSLDALALICGSGTTGCHGYIESHREEAYDRGWLVHSWDDPASIAWGRPSAATVAGVT